MNFGYPEVGYTPANLRHFIAQNGLLQRDVAAILGVSERSVRAWLADPEKPTHKDMPYEKWGRLLAWQPEKS
ncbi:helix-turn-helix transcriptional regulator [Wielerella bovis]|uniref:helix-turn-helix transcriptional regulator n=1 Tax=Wielerella bovis TaxID=2917790 RepID=UPI00201875A1|nr:helix-turn-helix transcriptional regulator [Wielerella bovis]ULJ65937.1 helix-turn-helix domain-containing protein [Wielerella bovis]